MDTIREFRVASEAWPDEDFEVRTLSNGLRFTGYAAVFGKWSENLGGFREVINPRAFTQSLKERGTVLPGSRVKPIKAFLNHNWDIVLGSTLKPAGKEQTLRLSTDSRGLIADIDLPDNAWGQPVRDAVDRGDISTMSFGFSTVDDEWNGSHTERELRELYLYEASPVTAWPAYPDTTAGVRAIARMAGVEEVDLLSESFRVLSSKDETLDEEQHALLMRTINARFHSPVADQWVAEQRARLLAKVID